MVIERTVRIPCLPIGPCVTGGEIVKVDDSIRATVIGCERRLTHAFLFSGYHIMGIGNTYTSAARRYACCCARSALVYKKCGASSGILVARRSITVVSACRAGYVYGRAVASSVALAKCAHRIAIPVVTLSRISGWKVEVHARACSTCLHVAQA